jgi:hypothetical protein
MQQGLQDVSKERGIPASHKGNLKASKQDSYQHVVNHFVNLGRRVGFFLYFLRLSFLRFQVSRPVLVCPR